MDFQQLCTRALEIRGLYGQLEEKNYGKQWTPEQTAHGFVGDVGDLMKLVLAKSGVRPTDNLDEKLAHELSDCLWSIMVLAHEYGVDLEPSFLHTMDELEARVKSQL